MRDRLALQLDGVTGSYASTPDSSSTSITGDLDLRIRVSPDRWILGTTQPLIYKWGANNLNLSYALAIRAAGTLNYFWTTDGASSTEASSVSLIGGTDGQPMWLRVTHDVDNLTSGNEVKFWTSNDGDSWTQLGSTVTNSGTTSIYDGTADLALGRNNNGPTQVWSGLIHYAEIRNGINGPVVALFDPSTDADTAASTAFGSRTGEDWTLQGSAQLVSTATEWTAGSAASATWNSASASSAAWVAASSASTGWI